jgi:uncharacterized alkaline shock family protein YloU
VEIDRRVVESLCGRVIDTFDGRLLISDPKGRLRRGAEKNPEEGSGFLRARLKDGKLNIKLFLIFRFGSSVRELAQTFAQRLREETPRATGMEAGLIQMVFVGTLSERVSKRKIVFLDDGEAFREIEADGEDDARNA